MYHFSAPMPYTTDDINKLLDINNKAERSKITSLYACLPSTCNMFTGFEQSRNFVFEHSDFDYWKYLIEFTLNKNCDFIYLLNSPRPLDLCGNNFVNQLERLNSLLIELKKLGVKKLRIASAQLIAYISKYYKDFDILASTSFEYKTIWEYQNFIYFNKNIKQIVPSHDINKNFKLLSALTKRYTNIEIELMVNEGCLQGCPNRILHEMINIDKKIIHNNDVCLSGIYTTSLCIPIINKYPIQSLVIGNVIFPWDIEEYFKLGIKNFKFVGRDAYTSDFNKLLNGYLLYLLCIDNEKKVENFSIVNSIHHLRTQSILKELSIKDYKKYFPKIKYFKKYGHLCASRCGVECRYCYKCAEKIQKIFEKKQEEQRKRTMPFCVMSK